MRILLIILNKEFLQIFRDKIMARMIFIMPLVQLLILANAVTFEIKNLRLYILDHDNSTMSSGLVTKFSGNKYFITKSGFGSQNQVEKELKEGKIDLYIEIPPNLEKDIVNKSETGVHITLNSIDGSKAGLAMFYSTNVVNEFMTDYSIDRGVIKLENIKKINVEYSHWFNPELNYITFMVPGILAMLVSLIGLFLSSINIVREKEIGTIEQLNVTPIKKYQLILGKLIPFWCIAMLELAFGLIIAKLVYNIPFLGNLGLLFGLSAIYLTVILGIGLFISTITETQQQAMFFTWFFTVIFILMSGLFTAIENMPSWAQRLTDFNPIKYYIESMRMIILKGSGISDIAQNIGLLVLYSIAINTFAIMNYRKRA